MRLNEHIIIKAQIIFTINMAKKLLGNRNAGGVEYIAGQVISDEESTERGFDATDVADTSEAITPAEGVEVAAKPDADAELDSATGAETTSTETEGKVGAEDSSNSGTESEDGKIPDGMIAVALTQEMFDADPVYAEHGKVVGDTVYVTPQE